MQLYRTSGPDQVQGPATWGELNLETVGVVWIDPVDKQVMRLEARLAKASRWPRLTALLRPGAGLVMEADAHDKGIDASLSCRSTVGQGAAVWRR